MGLLFSMLFGCVPALVHVPYGRHGRTGLCPKSVGRAFAYIARAFVWLKTNVNR